MSDPSCPALCRASTSFCTSVERQEVDGRDKPAIDAVSTGRRPRRVRTPPYVCIAACRSPASRERSASARTPPDSPGSSAGDRRHVAAHHGLVRERLRERRLAEPCPAVNDRPTHANANTMPDFTLRSALEARRPVTTPPSFQPSVPRVARARPQPVRSGRGCEGRVWGQVFGSDHATSTTRPFYNSTLDDNHDCQY
jgi:hypothetical protein